MRRRSGKASSPCLSEIETGKFRFDVALEDIHMNVEARLKEIIGAPAGRLHTARSRMIRWQSISGFGSATSATLPSLA